MAKSPQKPAKKASAQTAAKTGKSSTGGRSTGSTKRTEKVPSGKDPRQHAQAVFAKLLTLYPDARCALDHRNAYELLVATILSAQCTDKRVNMVTPDLFKKYPDPAALAGAPLEEIEEAVRTTGFYRNKAKSIRGASQIITEKFGGQVPASMDDLTSLPGVARKTANVVLGNAFGKNEGVVVDTHVMRLSRRLGLTRHTDAQKIENDLMNLFDRKNWTLLAHLLIDHGRAVCVARKPRCSQCALNDLCPKIGVGTGAE